MKKRKKNDKLLTNLDELAHYLDMGWEYNTITATHLVKSAINRIKKLEREKRKTASNVLSALGVGTENDVVLNLDGVVEDFKRTDADKVCIKTIKRAQMSVIDAIKVAKG